MGIEIHREHGNGKPRWNMGTGNPTNMEHGHEGTYLTHYRPTMPFGNREFYFIGSFQFSIVTIKKISPLWKPHGKKMVLLRQQN